MDEQRAPTGRHAVITVTRAGGYAARCESCGRVTFGGFETRAAARDALEREGHDGAASSSRDERGRFTRGPWR